MRYLITLVDSKDPIKADDARWSANGLFLEYIEAYSHDIVAIPARRVVEIRYKRRGTSEEGGMRFTGQHDSSFSITPGSIGEETRS